MQLKYSKRCIVRLMNASALIPAVLFLIITLVNFGSAVVERDNVVLTHVYFRHGERTPSVVFSAGEINGTQIWANDSQQLTELGKMQSYELGTWFRKRYSNLLPDEYHPDDILVQSSDVERTLTSATAVLAGLYPARKDSPFGAQLVPIHTAPKSCDMILSHWKSCRRTKQIMARVWKSAEMGCVLKKHSEYFDYLERISGRTGNTSRSVTGNIFRKFTLQNAIMHLYQKSNGTHPFDIELMESLDILGFILLPVITKELQVFSTGNLLSEAVEHMVHKKNVVLKPDRKMYMYSGHDSTVGPLMHTLGIYDAYPIPYAGALMIDLVLQSGFYYVKIYYRNSTRHDPVLLTLPDCEPSCRLEKFERIVRPFIAENWDEACNSVDNSSLQLEYTIPKRGNMKGWLECFRP